MRPIRDPERAALKHLIAACGLSGATVLEIGCGDGELTRQYAQRASKVIGIDPVISEVKIAVEKAHPGRGGRSFFLCGQGEHLPFDINSFDVVHFALSL